MFFTGSENKVGLSKKKRQRRVRRRGVGEQAARGMTPAAGGWRDPCCVGWADGRDADFSGVRAEPRAAEPVGGGGEPGHDRQVAETTAKP